MKTALLLLIAATLFAGEWAPDLYFQRMDKSTLSLREQAMGGSGYATGSGAGVLYTNAAQLVNMEGTEIRWTYDIRSKTENIDAGYAVQTEASTSYGMGRHSFIWSPSGKKKNRSGRLALGYGLGRGSSGESIEKAVWDPITATINKTGETYTDTQLEMFLTAGYGHPLPSKRDNFHHSLGGTVDLGLHYMDDFNDAIYELAQKYLLGYQYNVQREKFGKFSVGIQAGMIMQPRAIGLNHFTYHLAGGWNRIIGSSEKWNPVGITLEVGVNHDIYGSDSEKINAFDPNAGFELAIIERFHLRTGIRKHYEELEYSYGAGITPLHFLSVDFAARTFLESDIRKGQNQFAVDLRFHW